MTSRLVQTSWRVVDNLRRNLGMIFVQTVVCWRPVSRTLAVIQLFEHRQMRVFVLPDVCARFGRVLKKVFQQSPCPATPDLLVFQVPWARVPPADGRSGLQAFQAFWDRAEDLLNWYWSEGNRADGPSRCWPAHTGTPHS